MKKQLPLLIILLIFVALFFIGSIYWMLPTKRATYVGNIIKINQLAIAVSSYVDRYNTLPPSIEVLKKDNLGVKWIEEFGDIWNNPLKLKTQNISASIISYGKDGKLGGSGNATDWSIRLTFVNDKGKMRIIEKEIIGISPQIQDIINSAYSFTDKVKWQQPPLNDQ